MNIGILIDELIYGGFQKVAIEEVNAYRELGYKADLLVLRKSHNIGFEDLLQKYNIKPIYLNLRLPRHLDINFKFPLFEFFSFFHIWYAFVLPKYIHKSEYDFIITHGTYTALTSIRLAKKIPYVAFIHDSVDYILTQRYKGKLLGKIYQYISFLGKWLDKIIIKNAIKVIGFPDMIKYLKENIYPEYKEYYNIWNGCNPIYEKDIVEQKSNYWIAMTRRDQNKNLELLINIRKKIGNKPKLIIIGKFTQKNYKLQIKNYILQNGLHDYISIIGSVNEEELKDYYKNAKCLIHPCREAFGMTILEAAAHGCPSIFTNNSGVYELFDKEIQSFQPNESNIDQYISAIDNINSNYKNIYQKYYKIAIVNDRKTHSKYILSLINK